MAGQNLAASLGVPHPATGAPQGHHGVVDAMIGQPGHLHPNLVQAPLTAMSPQVMYAAQRGAFAGE
jgi:hypothetical protein